MPDPTEPKVDDAGVAGRVAVGRYALTVGDPAGTKIELRAPASERTDVRALARAIDKPQKKGSEAQSIPQALEGVADEASQVTGKIERTITLCTEVAAGRLDLASIADEIDALRSLAQRLDKDGHYTELLRLARCLSVLLSLARRWIALLSLLRTSRKVAKLTKDPNAEGWVLHELGTLHMAVGKHAQADELLTQARTLRERCGDRRGLAITDHNLQTLCRTLRRFLHEPEHGHMFDRLVRTPALAVLAGIALLAVGGTAGAMLAHENSSHRAAVSPNRGATGGKGRATPGKGGTGSFKSHPAKVDFSFEPASVHAKESVVFQALASDPLDPVAYYQWQFNKLGSSNGSARNGAVLKYAFSEPGAYEVMLTVIDAHHIATGSVAHNVEVAPPTQPASIALECSPESVDQTQAVTIEGSITPAQAGVTVAVEYKPEPSREAPPPVSRSVVTDASGHYKDEFMTEHIGRWHASSVWSSEPNNPVHSNSCTFTVRPHLE